MAIRYVNKRILLKLFYHAAPYLSVVFRAHIFWDTWYLPVLFHFQLTTKTEQQTSHMEALLYVVIRKFRYDETYNFDSQGEDEIMFLDYRRELKVLFDNLTQLNQMMVLRVVHRITTDAFRSVFELYFVSAEV